MTTPQWMRTISLALEIPFDSKEDKIWSKLLEKYSRFGDIFITSLSTIDIVRLPFINYSFIKYFSNLDVQSRQKQLTIFNAIQSEFQIHIRQRIIRELLDLQQKDQEEFKANLKKLYKKVTELQNVHPQEDYLANILTYLNNIQREIKELEDDKKNNELDSDS